jgi:hypothetical protein
MIKIENMDKDKIEKFEKHYNYWINDEIDDGTFSIIVDNFLSETKELQEQLEQKEFELKAADHVLAEKEKEIQSLSMQLDVSLKNAKHWYNKANLD